MIPTYKFQLEVELTKEEYEEVMKKLDRMHSRREDRYINFLDLKLFDFISGKIRDAFKNTFNTTE